MRFENVVRCCLLIVLIALLFPHESSGAVHPRAAERQARSATRDTQAKHAAAMAAQEKLIGGDSSGGASSSGRGADLRAIASPKKGGTTFTGFPEGTLPGSGGDQSAEQEKEAQRVALVGDPLAPVISEANIGSPLDRICAIADHVGYQMVLRRVRTSSSLEPPYTYSLMNGRRRLNTLQFDHQLKLVSIQ